MTPALPEGLPVKNPCPKCGQAMRRLSPWPAYYCVECSKPSPADSSVWHPPFEAGWVNYFNGVRWSRCKDGHLNHWHVPDGKRIDEGRWSFAGLYAKPYGYGWVQVYPEATVRASDVAPEMRSMTPEEQAFTDRYFDELSPEMSANASPDLEDDEQDHAFIERWNKQRAALEGRMTPADVAARISEPMAKTAPAESSLETPETDAVVASIQWPESDKDLSGDYAAYVTMLTHAKAMEQRAEEAEREVKAFQNICGAATAEEASRELAHICSLISKIQGNACTLENALKEALAAKEGQS